MKNKLLIGSAALVGSALVLFGAGCAGQPKPEIPPPGPKTELPPQAAVQSQEATSKNSTIVKDQKPGEEAMIDDVVIERKGYVVIHEDNDGKIGTIVGTSALLNAGETREVPVKMKVHPGLSHWAMLHADNGDGVFDAKLDLPIKDENGDTIMKMFKGEGEAMKKAAEEKMK